MRGKLTDEIAARAKELLGIDISQNALRLMPYVQYTMMNSQRLDPVKISTEERHILSDWRERGWIDGGASDMAISKDFWDAINELMWMGYVAPASMEQPPAQPKRIQLSRRKGYRKPDGAVNVARPTIWGNPYKVGETVLCLGAQGSATIKDNSEAVKLFRGLLKLPTRNYPTESEIVESLKGKDLACWCPLDEPCHADVLLEIANEGDEQDGPGDA